MPQLNPNQKKMSKTKKPTVSLPLTDVIPSDTPHHVAYDVIKEAIKQGEDKLADLMQKFEAGQKNLANLQKQLEDTKKFIENVQVNHVAVKSQVDAFKEALKKIADLDVPEPVDDSNPSDGK
jgi:septal ring factor EnvC (AmiA/AmiB activator)